MTTKTHRNCRNFAPVDTQTGLCVLTKETLRADDAACPDFALLPRCADCAAFTPAKDGAVCSASKTAFPAFADIVAVNCPDYSEKK